MPECVFMYISKLLFLKPITIAHAKQGKVARNTKTIYDTCHLAARTGSLKQSKQEVTIREHFPKDSSGGGEGSCSGEHADGEKLWCVIK